MRIKQKNYSVISSKRRKWAVAGAGNGEQQQFEVFEFFLERGRDFSLVFRQIRPSAVVGTRREVALRGEGFAWVPDLRSLDKLLEVGVSPYLGFTLYLNVFQCFGWLEALNSRLIGPKAWNQIDLIY